MIAIIDYGGGNVGSLASALTRLGQDYVITSDTVVIRAADAVLFPGQGRFGSVMKALTQSGLDLVIPTLTQPFLGICVGMQVLFDSSEEDDIPGLGLIAGEVKKLTGELPVPQMGWNRLRVSKMGGVLEDVTSESFVYFVHSYYVHTKPHYVLAETQYSQTAVAVVQKDNFYGVQFHPEKSGEAGMQILKNFCDLSSSRDVARYVSTTSYLPFQLWPAIDLINGECVRLSQGSYDEKTVYDQDPVSMALQFQAQGVAGLHLIDLDAAKQGKPMNRELILRVKEAISIPVQIGGGIRSIEVAEHYLSAGIDRVIIGTAAIKNPDLVKELVNRYGSQRVVVSLDVKDGTVAIGGWLEDGKLSLEQAVQQMTSRGVKEFIVTDVSKDGLLQGSNEQLLSAFNGLGCNVLLAGGVTDFNDISRAQLSGARGVVIGKALYEGKLSLGSNLTKRVIPCMDIADGRVVKGTNFTKLKDAGDPVELAKLYSKQGADELVFLDINATVENRNTLYELVEQVAANVTVPFTVGGGIRTIEEIRELLKRGVDKVSIGSAAVTNPEFVRNAAEEFGSQCIVISVDPKWNSEKKIWEIYIKGGRENTGINAIEFVQHMEQLGAGELLVNSLDRDGMKNGYDLKLLNAVTKSVSLPVIASSGVGALKHFQEVFEETNVDAALAASVFHSQELLVSDVKAFLTENNISVREVI